MPAVGDQHRLPASAVADNPFDDQQAANEKRQHVNEYTAVEIARLQSRLDKQLGPEYISSRLGPGGGRVHYLAAEKVIGLANEIFGFNGWSSAIQQIQIDFVDEHPSTGKVSLGLSVVVRVTLKDGTYHEDIGYGSVENARGKSVAFEKAKKEGTTDALKRALRNFGNVLGNCIYSKDYVSRITKVKVGTGRWDPDNLHRHRDFEPSKEEEAVVKVVDQKPPSGPTTVVAAAPVNGGHDNSASEIDMGSFDMGDFDDAEFDTDDFAHPDEVALPPNRTRDTNNNGNGNGNGNSTSSINNSSNNNRNVSHSTIKAPKTPSAPASRPVQAMPAAPNSSGNGYMHRNSAPAAPAAPAAAVDGPRPGPTPTRTMGFYSARAAGKIDQDNNAITPSEAPKFDPHAQSPSIRKTSGVDHTRSVRLTRSLAIDTDIPHREEPAVAMDQQRPLNVKINNNNNNNNHPHHHHRPLPNQAAHPVPVPVPLPGSGAGAGAGAGAGGGPMVRATVPTSRSYRPLTRRAPDSPLPPPQQQPVAARQALQDVSNLQQQQQQHHHSIGAGDGPDMKRQKLASGTGVPAGGVSFAPAGGGGGAATAGGGGGGTNRQ